ncbi:hypothetical protein SAMN04490204_1630 [Pseudomonas thivervalensis]|nr:hypothetical protein SAMN04490204_1630 [Pseudomonas thivervalensis]
MSIVSTCPLRAAMGNFSQLGDPHAHSDYGTGGMRAQIDGTAEEQTAVVEEINQRGLNKKHPHRNLGCERYYSPPRLW